MVKVKSGKVIRIVYGKILIPIHLKICGEYVGSISGLYYISYTLIFSTLHL